jgi:uncharacterized protein (TIGR00251 family)
MLPDGLELRLRVTPRAGRNAVETIETLGDGRAVLKVRVRAPPTDGEANEAVRRLVAKDLGRPVSAVAVTAGAAARIKTLVIAGDAAALAARLKALMGKTG